MESSHISLTAIIQIIGIVSAVALYVINTVKKLKTADLQTVLDFATSLVEEGCAVSETKNRMMKREAASEAGKQLKKGAIEIAKDPVKVEQFLQKSLAPARQIAHDYAKDYILKSVDSIKNEKFKSKVKKALNSNTVDNAINMLIAGRKMGIGDPLKTYFFKGI